MTVEGFINAGYRLSAQVKQAEIDRAEKDAAFSYVAKVSNLRVSPQGNPLYTEAQGNATMQIAFILLLQRTAVATRSGGKTKESPNLSTAGYPSQSDFDNADRLLRIVQATPDGVPGIISELVDDIAGIYYRNKYLGL